MFTYLYETIFPSLGEFFGKLSAFANLSIGDLKTLFDGAYGSISLSYTNFFTGIDYIFSVRSFGSIFNEVFETIINVVFYSVPTDTVLWVALLIASVQVFLFVSLFKWVKGVFI